MKPTIDIEIAPDLNSLSERSLGHFVHLADQAIQERGRFMVVLSGGSTPRRLFTLLSGKKLEWERIHFFWGDERCVPPDHPESNFHMANDVLLSRIPVPLANVHRIPAELAMEDAAKEYESVIRRFFVTPTSTFDLVWLGLGTDGHTASLFPGGTAVQERSRWVVGVAHKVPPLPILDRITLTPVVFNAARQVIFLVAGDDKAEPLYKVMHDPFQRGILPAQAIKPVNGQLLWLVDQAAAQGLSADEINENRLP
jgi:6-phosphogluconolactonase